MIQRIIFYTVLSAAALAAAYPFLWMLATSFKSLQEAMTPSLSLIPQQILWRNYIEAFQAAPFARYFYNTLFVSVIITAAVVCTSLLAGYAFARLQFRGSAALFGLVMATMMIPFEATLIPNFVIISKLGWYNTYAALIVPWCANAFSIFLMRQTFLSLPDQYFDAARVDGCGHLRFLFRVGLPLASPTIAVVALFAFLTSYNALLWPLVVTGDEDMRVLQVGLTVFSNAEGVRFQLLMCASVFVIIPTIALYFVAQRLFVESALTSGIKA